MKIIKYYCFAFVLLLIMQPIICSTQPKVTDEQLQQKNTPIIISFFQKMIVKNIISIQHLKQLQVAHELINPISKIERDSASETFTWAKQLDLFLKLPVDMTQINEWAIKKIADLERAEDTRKQVHEDTREIHAPMRFVPIPVGKYNDEITHEAFEIQPGIEIQETPVTQWQWTSVMEHNPSIFIDGSDSEEVEMKGNKIRMRPDAPVENVSWNDVQEFIKKLNEPNEGYEYILPSVQEYRAVLQNVFGKHWIEDVEKIKTASYLELNGKRIWDITGNVWQWTRDFNEKAKQSSLAEQLFASEEKISPKTFAHLVFGGLKATNFETTISLKNTIRPIVCITSHANTLGLRLVRYQKNLQKKFFKRTKAYSLSWSIKDTAIDLDWQWNQKQQTLIFNDDTDFRILVEHQKHYSAEIQKTIKIMLDETGHGCLDPISCLPKKRQFVCDGWFNLPPPIKKPSNFLIQNVYPLTYLTNLNLLELFSNEINDIQPLAALTNLTTLKLQNNNIQNITPIASFSRLVDLDLSDNQIQDVSPLTKNMNLEKLDLSYNQIQNLGSLAYLTYLTELNLDHNQISKISSLAALKNLAILKLNDNQIQDISPIAQITNLTELWLIGNPIQDLKPLATLKNLKTIVLTSKEQAERLNAYQILPNVIISYLV